MQKWSIGRKLGAGFGGLVACILILGLVSLWVVNGLSEDLSDVGGKILRKSELSGTIETDSAKVRAETRALVLSAVLKRPQDFEKARTGGEQALTQLDRKVQEIRPLLVDPRAKAAAEVIAGVLPPWKESFRETAELAAAGKSEAANKIRVEKQVPLASQIEEAAATISAVQREVADAKLKEAGQRAVSNRWIIAAFIAVGLTFGLFIFWMVRGLVATLRLTVKDLTAGGEQVAGASGEISSTSQSLAQGAAEQAASIEEVSASMEEMTAMTKRNADNSAEATAMMTETVKQVDRSNAALADMVASMSSIKVSSEKVAKINKTIDEIAFQTNILALNAAVEAARAGEAGMGFAVVADEVRNLAQRSAVAAKDTAALIEESIANASQGTQRLDLVSAAIRGITEGAGKVKHLLDEVNESSKQQGQGIQQATTAISQVSTVTQTAAASAEECAAASEELSAQSQTVRDLVHSLSVEVEGGSAEERSEARPRTINRAPRAGAGSRFQQPKVQPVIHRAPSKTEDPFPMEPVETGSFRDF
jgi:methyl-accepting chemotaxis protein